MPKGVPGKGVTVLKKEDIELAGFNVCGRVYMESYDDPFACVNQICESLTTPHRFLDFHAEATSEKVAMGWHLDGRVSAMVGTHTHVPTADFRVLEGGTAYITDLGMTGSRDGVIGMQREASLRRFVTNMHQRFEPAEKDPWVMGVRIELDPTAPRALSISQLLIPAS